MKLKLHNLIFVGMAGGVGVGLGLWYLGESAQTTQDPQRAATMAAAYEHILWWLNLLGPTIFISALKMIIAPLIFASIVAGVTSLPNMKELGAIGWKTMAYYIITTTIAVTIGLICVLTIQPGKKAAAKSLRADRIAHLDTRRVEFEELTGTVALREDGEPSNEYLVWLAELESAQFATGDEARRFARLATARERTSGDMFKQDIILPLITNPFTSLAASPPNALGLIFFALLLGLACIVVGEPARPLISFFHSLNAVILQVTHWLMSISPFAIACIVAWLVGEKGPAVFGNLGWYCGTVIGGIVIHVIILLAIARIVGGIGPLRLWRGIREAWLIAFSTRSSAATLPVTLACATEKLKVSPKVANFSIPVGATVNMDGTALYEGVAIIFLIQIYGGLDDVSITMTAMATFLIFITAVLASVGAAAVPDAGLVTMVLVASAVHLPIYYIPLIFAVDAFLDMFRTSTNVLGDTVGAIVVNRLERKRLGEPVAS
ncbi:MAG: dicarboxylate/amino acid:cation symporter [Phycisphaerae bacterium]|nr:dicarboxylate/amino acid:cation symporter [Phycisphaerae bacterium]